MAITTETARELAAFETLLSCLRPPPPLRQIKDGPRTFSKRLKALALPDPLPEDVAAAVDAAKADLPTDVLTLVELSRLGEQIFNITDDYRITAVDLIMISCVDEVLEWADTSFLWVAHNFLATNPPEPAMVPCRRLWSFVHEVEICRLGKYFPPLSVSPPGTFSIDESVLSLAATRRLLSLCPDREFVRRVRADELALRARAAELVRRARTAELVLRGYVVFARSCDHGHIARARAIGDRARELGLPWPSLGLISELRVAEKMLPRDADLLHRLAAYRPRVN